MSTRAGRHLVIRLVATFVAAALPLCAAHAVQRVEGSFPAPASHPSISDLAAECPPHAATDPTDPSEQDVAEKPAEGAGGGAAGMEQTPRWKTLLPGSLR